MSAYTTQRLASGWRFVTTLHDDTLQAVALRELGDAGRWAELASLNELIPPYLTDDVALATVSGGKVKLYGQAIRVFAPTAAADADTDPDEVFGADLALTNGLLEAVDGDFAIVSGMANLSTALTRRIMTDRRELPFHPLYGSDIGAMKGRVNGPTAALLATRYARTALAEDSRVDRIPEATAKATGDVIALDVTLNPISGGAPVSLAVEV